MTTKVRVHDLVHVLFIARYQNILRCDKWTRQIFGVWLHLPVAQNRAWIHCTLCYSAWLRYVLQVPNQDGTKRIAVIYAGSPENATLIPETSRGLLVRAKNI